jgi:tetratricopeptide (TPR) repeat protein
MADEKISTKKIDGSLTKIWQLYEAEKIEDAYILAENTIKLYPSNSQLNYILGLIHYDKSDFVKALYCFNNAKKLEKESKRKGFIDYWIGKTYEYNSWSDEVKNPVFDKKKALLAYKSAKEHPSFPADTILKLVGYADKDYEKVNLYEFGIEKFPSIVDFYIRLSQLNKRMGYPSKQLKCLLKGEENGLKSSSIYFNLGNYFFDIKNYEKSKEYYLKSLEINDNDRALDCLYYVIGNSCFKLKEYSLAIEYYKKSVDACKNESSSWYGLLGLIVAYDKLKKNSEIIKLFDSLIIGKELFENISFAYGMMAYLDSQVMEDIEFRQDLNQVLLILKKIKWETKAKELHLKFLLLHEAIFSQLNLHMERLISIRKTLNFITAYHFLEEKLHSAYLSNIETTSDLKETVLWFTQDKSIISDNVVLSILSSLIKKLAQLKEYKKIVQLSNDFTQSDLVSADILFEYAYALNEDGNEKGSKKFYEKYLEIHPKSTASLNNLGVIFMKEENYEKAISLYKQAIKFDNQNDLYQRNLKISTELLVKKQKENKLKKIPGHWLAEMA